MKKEKILNNNLVINKQDTESEVCCNKKNIVKKIIKLTQQELADKANICYCQYQRVESGERDILKVSFNVQIKILIALELKPIYYFQKKYIIESNEIVLK